jgi:hypothetical protein
MANEIPPPQRNKPIEPKTSNLKPLLRLAGWGAAACVGIFAVVVTGQTEAGAKRLRQAFAFDGEPAPAVAALGPTTLESIAENKRLAAQLHELSADRDRLTARIVTLEHSLDDMTGSIKRQDQQAAAARTTPQPAPNAPGTVAAAPAPAELPYFVAMRMPQAAEPPLPPRPAEALPRVASVALDEPAAKPAAKGEFAIDLGGAASVEALRGLWASLNASHGPLLAGLQPRVTEHPKLPTGFTYRLVAGPLRTAEEAKQLCARFPALRTGCHAAKFGGAELAAH